MTWGWVLYHRVVRTWLGQGTHLNQEPGCAPGARRHGSGNTSAPRPSPFPLLPVGRSRRAPPVLPWQNVPVKPGLQLQTGLSPISWQSPWCWQGFGRQASGLLCSRGTTPCLGPRGLPGSPAAKERRVSANTAPTSPWEGLGSHLAPRHAALPSLWGLRPSLRARAGTSQMSPWPAWEDVTDGPGVSSAGCNPDQSYGTRRQLARRVVAPHSSSAHLQGLYTAWDGGLEASAYFAGPCTPFLPPTSCFIMPRGLAASSGALNEEPGHRIRGGFDSPVHTTRW